MSDCALVVQEVVEDYKPSTTVPRLKQLVRTSDGFEILWSGEQWDEQEKRVRPWSVSRRVIAVDSMTLWALSALCKERQQ